MRTPCSTRAGPMKMTKWIPQKSFLEAHKVSSQGYMRSPIQRGDTKPLPWGFPQAPHGVSSGVYRCSCGVQVHELLLKKWTASMLNSDPKAWLGCHPCLLPGFCEIEKYSPTWLILRPKDSWGFLRIIRIPKDSEGFLRIPRDSSGFLRIPEDSWGFLGIGWIPKDF